MKATCKCGASYRVDNALKGKKAKCKKCGEIFVLTSSQVANEVAAREMEDKPLNKEAVKPASQPLSAAFGIKVIGVVLLLLTVQIYFWSDGAQETSNSASTEDGVSGLGEAKPMFTSNPIAGSSSQSISVVRNESSPNQGLSLPSQVDKNAKKLKEDDLELLFSFPEDYAGKQYVIENYFNHEIDIDDDFLESDVPGFKKTKIKIFSYSKYLTRFPTKSSHSVEFVVSDAFMKKLVVGRAKNPQYYRRKLFVFLARWPSNGKYYLVPLRYEYWMKKFQTNSLELAWFVE